LDATIPANTTATVYLPLTPGTTHVITANGEPLPQADGVKVSRLEKDCAILKVESGSYAFSVINHP
jgi:hypothetical protein